MRCIRFNILIPSITIRIQLSILGGETVKRQLTILFSLAILASLFLAACGGAAPEAPA
jgi:hypothetical protein